MEATYNGNNSTTQQDDTIEVITTTATSTSIPRVGPLGGFGHMLKKQMRDWYSTRRWLWVGGLATGVIVGIVLAIYIAAQVAATQGESIPEDFVLQVLMTLLGSYFVMTAVLVSMSEVIEEKKSGTAAWIMSKPASRYGFILSKWVAASINISVLGLLIPGITGLALVSLLFGVTLSIANIALALGILVLYYTMTVALTIFLGVVMKSQGAVAAVAIGMIVLLPMLNVLPGTVSAFLPTSMATVATTLIETGELLTYLPMFGGVILLVASLVAGSVLFNKQEL